MTKANGYKTTPFIKGKRRGAVEKALRLSNHDVTVSSPSDDFFSALIKARPAFAGAKLRAACEDGGATADLILHLLSDRPLSRGDRRSLANLLAGELHSSGRPRAKAADLSAYLDLLAAAKRKRRELSGADATDRAANWAAKDSRAQGRAPSTIVRDMGRRRAYWGV